MSTAFQSHVKSSTTEVGGLIPFFGIPCILLSVYTDYPGCIGGIHLMTCCCISYQQAIFKPTNRPKSCMVCTSSECEFIEPVPILKSDFQYFCLDVKMSFPPDETNPCIFNLCFFTMMFESRPMVACFKKVSQLKMVQP